jgi:hypothetical protein
VLNQERRDILVAAPEVHQASADDTDTVRFELRRQHVDEIGIVVEYRDKRRAVSHSRIPPVGEERLG